MPSISANILPMRLSRTGTPRLSTGLVASLLAHCVRLTLVLGHAGVHSPALLLAMLSRFLVASAFCAYWTMSGRIGALKTFGRVRVSLPAAPSAPWTVTVGREDMVAVWLVLLSVRLAVVVFELLL